MEQRDITRTAEGNMIARRLLDNLAGAIARGIQLALVERPPARIEEIITAALHGYATEIDMWLEAKAWIEGDSTAEGYLSEPRFWELADLINSFLSSRWQLMGVEGGPTVSKEAFAEIFGFMKERG